MSAIPPIGGSVPPAPSGAASQSARPRATGAAADAGLWQVLNDEERAYFDAVAALGPVSYGRGGVAGNAPPSPVGQRVDVKA